MKWTPPGPNVLCLTQFGLRRDVYSSGESAQVPAQNADKLQNFGYHDDRDA